MNEPANGTPKVSVSRRLFVALALIAVLSPLGVTAAAVAIFQVRDLVHQEEAEEEVEEARACVTSWEIRDRIRLSDEEHGEAGGEALIEAVQPELDENGDLVERYRRLLRENLRRASDTIPNPTCDLEAARRLLGER